MDLSSMGVFKLMAKKMDWLTQRQEVLAQNVANVDTPKFKPDDVTPFTFRTALQASNHLEPAMTNPAHQHLAHANDGPGSVRKERKPYETKPDGNAVDIEEQMLKLSQTSQDFNMVTSLYRKNVSLIKSVLARGN
ncbi:MAG: flagellar basal body rod protein FlgB [Rhodospirillaceae bacterium]